MTKRLLRFAVLFALAVLPGLGCAPAYHAYPCGCVPLGYRPGPPLPFHYYHGCPTPLARYYAEQASVAATLDEPLPEIEP